MSRRLKRFWINNKSEEKTNAWYSEKDIWYMRRNRKFEECKRSGRRVFEKEYR